MSMGQRKAASTGISIANAPEIPQPCTKSSIWDYTLYICTAQWNVDFVNKAKMI